MRDILLANTLEIQHRLKNNCNNIVLDFKAMAVDLSIYIEEP